MESPDAESAWIGQHPGKIVQNQAAEMGVSLWPQVVNWPSDDSRLNIFNSRARWTSHIVSPKSAMFQHSSLHDLTSMDLPRAYGVLTSFSDNSGQKFLHITG